jgi:hypothetical protein
MSYERILEAVRRGQFEKILGNENATDWQKAADIHALMADLTATASQPRAERKKREPRAQATVSPAGGLLVGNGEGSN